MKEAEAKIAELQEYVRELRAVIEDIKSKIIEMEAARSVLKELEKDQECLFPIGAGVLVKGKVIDPDTLVIMIREDIMIKKDRNSVLELLEKRIEEAKETLKKYQEEYKKAVETLQMLYATYAREDKK